MPQSSNQTCAFAQSSSEAIRTRAVVRDEAKKKAGGTDHSNRRWERLPCDCDKRQAEAAAAARPRADLQLMSPCSPQEGLIATHLLQHQDQELEHHDGKVAAGR